MMRSGWEEGSTAHSSPQIIILIPLCQACLLMGASMDGDLGAQGRAAEAGAVRTVVSKAPRLNARIISFLLELMLGALGFRLL
jgi:hypothetical protein